MKSYLHAIHEKLDNQIHHIFTFFFLLSKMTTNTPSDTPINPLAAVKAQREALKNFYKLKQTEDTSNNTPSPPNDDTKSITSSHKNSIDDLIDSFKIEDIEEFINTESYINILKTEDKVLDKLNSAKSDIKSIIYNNYYELIKINSVLEGLILPNDNSVHLDNISNNLTTIRSNIKNIASINTDIFNDLNNK